jgi:glutaredoxin
MANTIIIFTLKGCGHCTELKKGLTELTIPFNEIEITENETIWNQVIKQTGHNSLPTVFIGLEGKENGPVFVPERDFKDKDEIIEIIKKYI